MRGEKFPAFSEACAACGTIGHDKSQCKGGSKNKPQKTTETLKVAEVRQDPKVAEVRQDTLVNVNDDAQLNSLTVQWFLIKGNQPVLHPQQQVTMLQSQQQDTVLHHQLHPQQQVTMLQSQQQDTVLHHQLQPQQQVTVLQSHQQETVLHPHQHSRQLAVLQQQLSHQLCDRNGCWFNAKLEESGQVPLHLQVAQSGYTQYNMEPPPNHRSTRTLELADTGAQMCVCDVKLAQQVGINKCHFINPMMKITVADNSGLQIAGAAFLTITGPGGHSTNQLVYFAYDVNTFYLSKAACRNLHIINSTFPHLYFNNSSQLNTPQPTHLGLGT